MATIPAQRITELVHRLQTTQKIYESMKTPAVYIKDEGDVQHKIVIEYNCRLIEYENGQKKSEKFISPAEVVVKVFKEGFVLQ